MTTQLRRRGPARTAADDTLRALPAPLRRAGAQIVLAGPAERGAS